MHATKLLTVAAVLLGAAHAQFEAMNSLWAPDSYLTGIKNVMGGVLGADSVHKKCLQKMLCQEFSDEVVEVVEEADPVKRTVVRVPRVVQRRGRLRWVGDMVETAVAVVSDRLGLNPYAIERRQRQAFRRRQGGPIPGPGLAAKAVGFVLNNWSKIPLKQIFHVMDFGADVTNGMTRKGAVYPFAKSAAIGYGYGHRREDEFDGVCSQVAPDCGSMWDHLETVNEYDGGTISRKTAQRIGYERDVEKAAEGLADPNDPLMWNHIRADQVLLPKVFLCKAGKFLEKLNDNMGSEGLVKERYEVPELDVETCNPHHVAKAVEAAAEAEAAAVAPAELALDDIEIIDARAANKTATEGENKADPSELFGDLPVIVFEGLPDPGLDQTEEDLVESVLRLVNISQTSVRTALRLPLRARGNSLVLVELDTGAHRDAVLKHKDDIRKFRSSFVKIGIRRAKYRELWNVVKKLMTVKAVNESIVKPVSNKPDEEEDPISAEVVDVDDVDYPDLEDYQVIDAKNEEKKKADEEEDDSSDTAFKIDGGKLQNLVEQTLSAINSEEETPEEEKEQKQNGADADEKEKKKPK